MLGQCDAIFTFMYLHHTDLQADLLND